MNPQILGIITALAAVLFVIEMLRRGMLPERFAALWITVSVALLGLAVIPGVLEWAAKVTGIAVPANLLFFGAAVVLLLVSVQLSYEVGRLDARTRRLAEEVAFLHDHVQDLSQRADGASTRRDQASVDPHEDA